MTGETEAGEPPPGPAADTYPELSRISSLAEFRAGALSPRGRPDRGRGGRGARLRPPSWASLHRDIKPSNLLLDARGTAWVTDFGLAKFEGGEDLTETGDIVGTIRYMAPERFEGRSDARCDIYALGATLYEMLALRPAFR